MKLSLHAEICAAVCNAINRGLFRGEMPIKDICSASGLASARASDVERMLVAGQDCGLFERRSELGWASVKGRDFTDLALMLEAASLYRQEVHEEQNIVEVVLTRPPRPCKLEEALDAAGYASAILENTVDVFMSMAISASQRFAVMTPFLDELGAKQLVELFRRVPTGVTKVLIVRYMHGAPPLSLVGIKEELRELDVRVFDYWLPRSGSDGYETFHAKVILTDSNVAYVGSANMTETSFFYSMEMGLLVKGQAAGVVGRVVDEICRIAKRRNMGQ
ncbi:MAG: hypothetical protein K8F53_07415 [Rhodocyclaceae bacterium]|nr:hypothetical protein [Rhodocyclaceae bacterium]